MKLKIKKLISIILIINILVFSVSPAVLAQEYTGNEEVALNTENISPTPEPTTIQPTETPTESPTVTPVPVVVSPTAIPTPTSIPEDGDVNRTYSSSSAYTLGVNPTPTSAPAQNPSSTSNGVGDASVTSGDANSTANVTNSGNNNLALSGPSAIVGTDTSGASIVNSENGSDSSNSGSASITNTDNTNQANSANVNTGLNQSSTTGENTTSYNVGNSSIETGDANVTGTVVTAVNTNVDGVLVSEFNIADDHIGDILLDFAANCVSGCGSGPINSANIGNGTNSDNTAAIDQINNSNTFQSNDAFIGSELNLSADSGNNQASYNVGGDSNIKTGDANVAANVLTFANNNIAGDVVYAVVNIFGDLVGDILFPEEFMSNCCSTNTSATNSSNGSDSINNANIDSSTTENTFQNNDASITNDLVFDAQTGDNESNYNTGGDSTIKTGNTTVEANVLNIANTNLIGGNMWLVLVNEAGNWIGKILGAPDDANFAGSAGTEFNVDENGFITASNNGNGSGSTNSSDVTTTATDTTIQNNNAVISNTLNLSANTGGNEANANTGGDSKIETGDATIVANLVNFVNNNIKGNGKLFVTVVNVFGSWFGDFVSPGTEKQTANALQNQNTNSQNVGGPNSQSDTSTVSSQNSADTNSRTTGTGEAVLVVTPQHANLISYSSPVNSEDSDDSETGKAMVKGVSAENVNTLGVSESDGKIKINLAWLVVMLPLALVAIGTKKVLMPKLFKKI
jgi:hypothetical protein